jgi:hypothetical protein
LNYGRYFFIEEKIVFLGNSKTVISAVKTIHSSQSKIIVVDYAFEGPNGLIGMNRDVVMKLIKIVSRDEKSEEKIRNVSMCFFGFSYVFT